MGDDDDGPKVANAAYAVSADRLVSICQWDGKEPAGLTGVTPVMPLVRLCKVGETV